MAVKYESTLENYKSSSSAKKGGVHSEQIYHPWKRGRNEFPALVTQGKEAYGNDFGSLAEMKAFATAFLAGIKGWGSAEDVTEEWINNVDDEDDLYALFAVASHDRYLTGTRDEGKFDGLHSSWVAPMRNAIEEFNTYKRLIGALEEKGLSENQINQFLSSNKVQGKDGSRLDLLAEEIPDYSIDDFAGTNGFGVTKDTDADGNTLGLDISPAADAAAEAPSPEDQADAAVTETVLGKSGLDDLRNTPGFVEENGKYYLNQLDEDGKPVLDEDGNPVRQEFTVDENNNQIVYVGGDKNGDRWSVPGTSKADTVDQMGEDERAAYESIKGLTEEYGQFGKDTLAAIDAPENDFAGQINAQLNQFLTGRDAEGNSILGADKQPIKGFLDYQSDLEGAGQTLKTDMQGLQATYDRLYSDYGSELRPLTDEMAGATSKLGDVADASMGVAEDAGDENYYTRLKNLLYADAQDQIDRSTRDATGNLQQMYANSGMDTSSPAYTAAMMDLQKSRSDAQRSSNRQAILDSYGLGSQMLTNRSTALGNAGNAYSNQISGIGSQMNALDSLYGVQLQGLNNRKDMIGQIYNVDKNNATVGMQGLNTVLDTGLKGISANQTQFNKNIDLTNSIYSNLINAQSGIRNLADQEGRTAEGDLIDFSNAGKSDDFTYGSFELALQQAYPDGDIPDSLQTLLEKYNPNK